MNRMSACTNNASIKAPFPFFGGKSRAASLIWERLGKVDNYVEPFAGSLAVLLGAPQIVNIETVNDIDGFIANFWRAVGAAPDEVAQHADHPVNELDLTARHVWLVNYRAELTAHLESDPDFYDAKVAGWWCWGLCCWIGSGWCSGKGPWGLDEDGSQLVHLGDAGQGVNRQLVHLGSAGRGVNRQLVHLGNAGHGVTRQLVQLGNAGHGVNSGSGCDGIYEWFRVLSERLRRVRVCCGSWERVLGPTPTTKQGLTGIVLDPPYSDLERDGNIYACEDGSIAIKVREWAIEHGDDPLMRIVLCGYEGNHAMPDGWQVVEWKAAGGYGSQGHARGRENSSRERLWFSPRCEGQKQQSLFNLNRKSV